MDSQPKEEVAKMNQRNKEVRQFCLIGVLIALVGCEDGRLLNGKVAPTVAAFAASPSLVVSGSPTEVTWTWSYANTPKPAPDVQH